jgi:hypothetical protein
MENITVRETEPKPIPEELVQIYIPDCCREGHADCPHVAKRERVPKKNIGL